MSNRDYDNGFDPRATIDTVDEIMMEARNSISFNLSQLDEEHEIPTGRGSSNRNSAIYKHNEKRIHSKTNSNMANNVLSIDKITMCQSLKMIWKVLVIQILFASLSSIFIILSLWILSQYLCQYSLYNSYFFILYLIPIYIVILDEFKEVIFIYKRISIILFLSILIIGFIFLFSYFDINIIPSLALISIFTISIFGYFCGYHAIYMIFPLLIALIIDYILYYLILYMIIDEIHNEYIVVLIYPLIIHLLQIMNIKIIQYLQLSYTFNLFMMKLRKYCRPCWWGHNDKEEEEGEDDDNDNGAYHDPQEDIRMEDAVSEQYMFLICSLIAIIYCTLQFIGYLMIIVYADNEDMTNLIIIISILYIIFEVIARNKLWNEIYVRIKYKSKRDINMDTISQIYFGVKYSMQYVVFVIVISLYISDEIMEIESMEHVFCDLFLSQISIPNYSMIMISIIMLFLTLLIDLSSFGVKKCGIKCEIYGIADHNNQDITRQYKFIKINCLSLTPISISCCMISLHFLYIFYSFFVVDKR